MPESGQTPLEYTQYKYPSAARAGLKLKTYFPYYCGERWRTVSKGALGGAPGCTYTISGWPRPCHASRLGILLESIGYARELISNHRSVGVKNHGLQGWRTCHHGNMARKNTRELSSKSIGRCRRKNKQTILYQSPEQFTPVAFPQNM